MNRRRPTDRVTCKHCGKEFKAITYRHLRNIHGYEGDHPILEYKERFRLEVSMCRETRRKISAAKDDYWTGKGQHWTPSKLIAEIRRMHEAGESLNCKAVPVRLYEAARRLYGTWERTLEAAEVDYEEATGARRWDRSKIVAEILRLAALGVPLHASFIEHHHPQLFHAAIKEFPRSWAKALRGAGLDPDRHKMPRGQWTRATAEDWLLRRVREGQPIQARDAPRDLLGFVYSRLRTNWTDFVESFGISYPGVKKRRDWTKAEVLSEIQRRHAEGRSLGYRAVQRENQALIHQTRKFCGSWAGGCAEAGV